MNHSRKTKQKGYSRQGQKASGRIFSGPLSIGLCKATLSAKDPVDAIIRYARKLVRLSGLKKPPYQPATYAYIRRVSQIVYREMEAEGRLIPSQAGFTMELRADRSHGRKNFTCAHEVAHTFFYEAVPSIKYRRLSSHEFIQDEEEEFLCNVAASELLMPQESIREIAPDYVPSPDSLQQIAHLYETSLAATAIRLLGLNLWDAKFVLWELNEDGVRARWFAQPGSALTYFPSLVLENPGNSSIREAFRSSQNVSSEEWVCIDRRFMYCQIRSVRLANSNRVLSCIGSLKKRAVSSLRQAKPLLPFRYNCECNGTGTRLIHKNGGTYAATCLACQAHETY